VVLVVVVGVGISLLATLRGRHEGGIWERGRDEWRRREDGWMNGKRKRGKRKRGRRGEGREKERDMGTRIHNEFLESIDQPVEKPGWCWILIDLCICISAQRKGI
jgi:hypothetical protein